MKKIWKSLLLILLSMLLFAGCAGEAEPIPISEPTPEDAEPSILEEADEDEMEIDNNSLGVTLSDVLSSLIAFEDSFIEIDSVQLDGLTLTEFGGFYPVQIRVFAVVEDGQDKVCALLVTLTSGLQSTPLRNWERTGTELSRFVPENVHIDEFEHRRLRILSIRALDSSFTNAELGAFIRPEATIFNYYREEMDQYLNTLDFPGMLTLIESYMDEHTLTSDDATHRLHELALQGVVASEGIVHVVDSFDGSINAYFSDLRRINQSVHVVPFFEAGASGGSFRLRLGFHRNGWIFFEHTSLRIEEGVHFDLRHDYFDVNRNVLGGSLISEERIISLPTTSLRRLLDDDYIATPMIIRFSGGDDAIHDHELTQVETEALRRFTELAQVSSAMHSIFRQNER